MKIGEVGPHSRVRSHVELGDVVQEALEPSLDALLVVERAPQDGGLEVPVAPAAGIGLGGAGVHVGLAARVRYHRVLVYGYH